MRKGFVSGLLIEILGGIAKLRVGGGRAARLHALVERLRRSSAANNARPPEVDALQTVAGLGLPILRLAPRLLRWPQAAGSPIDVAGDFAAFNSRSSASSPRLFLSLTTCALGLRSRWCRCWPACRPVFDAPLEVEHTRVDPGLLGAHDRRARRCRSATATTGRGCWRTSTSRRGRARASRSSAPRARASRRCCACCSGFETPARGSVFYDGKDLEKLEPAAGCAARSAPCWRAAGLVPGSLFDNIAGARRCRADRGHGRRSRLAGLADDIAAMPMGMHTLRDAKASARSRAASASA